MILLWSWLFLVVSICRCKNNFNSSAKYSSFSGMILIESIVSKMYNLQSNSVFFNDPLDSEWSFPQEWYFVGLYYKLSWTDYLPHAPADIIFWITICNIKDLASIAGSFLCHLLFTLSRPFSNNPDSRFWHQSPFWPYVSCLSIYSFAIPRIARISRWIPEKHIKHLCVDATNLIISFWGEFSSFWPGARISRCPHSSNTS